MELTPEELRVELDWIAAHTNGRPFGLDLIVPNAAIGKDESISDTDLVNMVPDGTSSSQIPFSSHKVSTHQISLRIEITI